MKTLCDYRMTCFSSDKRQRGKKIQISYSCKYDIHKIGTIKYMSEKYTGVNTDWLIGVMVL
jgi:hypothetical protein